MRTRTPLLALLAGAVLALAPAAEAATPFTAGTGAGHDLAVGDDGKGHVVWRVDAVDDEVRYCRVPAGGTACEHTRVLAFDGAATQSPNNDVQVFWFAPNKVVVLGSCTQCPFADQQTIRFTSTNNGDTFDGGTQVGTLQLERPGLVHQRQRRGALGVGVESSRARTTRRRPRR